MLDVKNLIKEYSRWLGRDLFFQNIDDELNDPVHKYTAPEGEILTAIDEARYLEWLLIIDTLILAAK